MANETTTDQIGSAGTPEADARKTIDHLLHGRLVPKTIADVDKAVRRANSDSAIGHLGKNS